MILRLTENVPEVYVDESRDFQLLCRLYDLSNQEVKFNILTMLNAYTPTKFSNRMLYLLADRVGFKTSKYIDDRVLRYILAAFPYIIKNKGTKLGIEQAVNTILKAENSLDPPFISIDSSTGTVIIITPITVYNKVALEELLKYVVPTGYYYNIQVGTHSDALKMATNAGDGLGYVYQPSPLNEYVPDNLLGIIRKGSKVENPEGYREGTTKSTYGETETPVINTASGDESKLLADKYAGTIGTTVVTKISNPTGGN